MSSFMTQRDSNRGMCSHPCRWQYAVVEQRRPEMYFPVAEDNRGTYVFNSQDLCMLSHIPEMVTAGIDSLKIEGRMKSVHYVAATVKIYREAIDAFYNNPKTYEVDKRWVAELSGISHRPYCTGFYFEDPDQIAPNFENRMPETIQTFLGKVVETPGRHQVIIDVRNKIFTGESIEILTRNGPPAAERILKITDNAGCSLPHAQPNSQVTLLLQGDYDTWDLIRRPGQNADNSPRSKLV